MQKFLRRSPIGKGAMAKNKKWNIGDRNEAHSVVAEISKDLGIAYITAKLLYERGYHTSAEAKAFINLETELFHDPFLMQDMDKACGRILRALGSGEKIVIYGDYDVDGVTSVSILYLYLSECGGNVGYYIPSRAGEGYGVNKEAVKKLAEEGAKLFLTVDTGITAVSETEYAVQLGCDVIVTDHHECHGELPDACAVVNPRRSGCRYPFKELAGVGVAFKLITALEYTLRKNSGRSTEGFLAYVCQKYIDLVAIGTVADVMPLRDENRLIVSMGLGYMNRSARPGVKALLDASDGGKSKQRKKATSSLIGFTLAPRINAAGRINTAALAVELFLTDSEAKAAEIASELCEINRKRQYEENKIVEQIRATMESDSKFGDNAVIVLDDENWHHGVIGIVASRVTEKYSRPSILISFEGDIGKGSGRSIKGLNLVEALDACGDLLIKYGGHELAAGLSIEKERLPEFRQRINEYARERLSEADFVTDMDIDCELYPEEITLRQAEELELLEPFGVSNPVPLFMMGGLKVVDISPIGAGRHTKLILERNGERFPAVYFGISPDELGYVPGDVSDIVFNLNINEFQGSRSVQLVIRDIRLSDESVSKKEDFLGEYEAALRGEVWACKANFPKREDFVSVYLRLKRGLSDGRGIICINSLLYELNSTPGQTGPINYVRLRLALDILDESGVISLEEIDTEHAGMEMFGITVNNLEKKVNLEKSCLYKRLTNPAEMYTPV